METVANLTKCIFTDTAIEVRQIPYGGHYTLNLGDRIIGITLSDQSLQAIYDSEQYKKHKHFLRYFLWNGMWLADN